MKSLINPSGGLLYHAKAARWRKRHWDSLSLPLNSWLKTWPVESSSLVLIGPSAGYTLSEDVLMKFSHIHAVEPDFVARILFERRFPKIQIQWSSVDYFSPQKRTFTMDGVVRLLKDYPNSQFLFCNLFGQFPLLWPRAVNSASWRFWKKDLEVTLKDTPWAAWYDRLSGPQAPLELDSQDPPCPSISTEDLVRKHYSEYSGKIELNDHLTEGLFPNYLKKHFYWVLSPQNIHLIEATHHGMKES